jgi:hypothetical protein
MFDEKPLRTKNHPVDRWLPAAPVWSRIRRASFSGATIAPERPPGEGNEEQPSAGQSHRAEALRPAPGPLRACRGPVGGG